MMAHGHVVKRYLVMAATTLAAITNVGCREREARARPSSPPSHPAGYVVDSALPPDQLLARFRQGMIPVHALDEHAAVSRESLGAQFARAVAQRDSTTLAALSLSRAEFGYLYYPASEYTRPPRMMPPDVLWLLMQNRSERGQHRLIARLGGEFHLVGLTCEPTPRQEGENAFYEHCLVRYRRAGVDSVEQRRLFGSIIKRGGRYKFVSYANDF